MQTLFFKHLDELHSLHYAALPTVTSASHQMRNYKLIYLRFWRTIHKLQAMHFTKAKMTIITNCLLTDFLHGSLAGILLALVHSTEPARFNSQRVQPGNVAIHPICARNRVRQTPIVWHRISIRFNHVRPSGGSCRTSRQRKRCWLCRISNISCVQVSGSTRFTNSWFRATCML